jgi:hypothetical protein
VAEVDDTGQRVDLELDPKVKFWRDEIETYERMFDKFLRRGRKIYKKYKDLRSPREDVLTRYNILWANVQTRLPALYARNPKVQVERRFKDKDPIGRVGSEILERSIQYTLDHCNDAWQVNRQCVLDYELPGRATVWIRYVPHFKKLDLPAAQEEAAAIDETERGVPRQAQSAGTEAAESQPATGPSDTVALEGVQTDDVAPDPIEDEILHYEETKLDYVFWEDYGHSWARVDDEIRGKWRIVYMDRRELAKRFEKGPHNPHGLSADEIDEIPLDWSPKNLNDVNVKIPRGGKKAVVYEIWDKLEREVIWITKTFPRPLDIRDDPLGLEGFFPTPRGLYANLCNDDLVPTPNFTYYQDQANELDELSTRIASITKALKVAGVRDTSAEGLDRLLSEGVENQLIPVNGWAAMKEKGGLAGTFELLPMDMIADTLQKLRDQRTALIEDIYQLTGISDIVRGLSDPNETATAQQLKGQFSLVRIEDAQTEVQRFCRDEIRIIGQIVAGYSIDTLKAISGVKLLTNAEKQQIQMQLAAQARMQQMQQAMQQQQQSVQQQQQAPHPDAAAPAPPVQAPGMPPHPAMAPPGPMAAPGAPSAPGGMIAPHPQVPATPAPPQQSPQGLASPGAGAPPSLGNSGGGPAGGMHPASPGMPQTPAPGQAPLSPDKIKLLEEPTWEEVEALLKNPVLREFRLDMETDSTIRMDEEAEKSARLELIKAASEFVTQMTQAGMQAPEILPMLGELLMFGIRAFKTARAVEQTFEDMMAALEKAAKAPKPPPPEVVKAQAEGQLQTQLAHVKAQTDIAIAQGQQAAQAKQSQQENELEAQRDREKAMLDAQAKDKEIAAQRQIQELKNHFEAQRTQFEAEAKQRIAALDAQTKIEIAKLQNEQKQRDQEHERNMTRMQHSHEKEIAKMKPKSDKEAA